MRKTGRLGATVLGWLCMVSAAHAVCTPETSALESRDDADTLLVLLHAYNSDAASLEAVKATAVAANLEVAGVNGVAASGAGQTDVFTPELPFGLFSMARPEEVLADLLYRVDCLWQQRAATGRPYRRVLLIGHSMGALYARKLYVLASGATDRAPFEPELLTRLEQLGADSPHAPRPWAHAVERIVLLAGMNRGWSISHHMSLTRAVVMSTGVAVGRLLSMVYGREPTIFSIRRGAPFITQLRLQWLAMRAQGVGAALTVQLLGTVDDLVSPEDNIDLVTGKDFVYLEVPFSGHADVIRMGDDTVHGAARRDALHDALVLGAEDLAQGGQATALALDPSGVWSEPRSDVRQVVFVIHGIRDEGFWTQRIARRVIAKALARCAEADGKSPDCAPIATITSSYGYFPMLSFLWPNARQEKVEWLMDQYTQARARYPGAVFSYVGHSHGTYLLARALGDYPAARFDRVLFAGSVVERDYDWAPLLAAGRVGRVANLRATADWVVAFFPKTLEMLGLQDLGAAGHDGFRVSQATAGVVQPELRVVGGHSAALQESMWDAIAGFVLGEPLTLPEAVPTATSATWWVALPALAAPLVWVLIAGLLWLVLRWLLRLDLAEWQRTLALVGYAWLVWTVLTEV